MGRPQASSRAAPAFKDYYLTMQVHPEAEAPMIDAAYWLLAKRYNDARAADASARAKLDDLNEAYSVLRSPERREKYNRVRDAVLGVGALPAPPPPPPEPLPLSLMERQRPRPRREPAPPARRSQRFKLRLPRG